MSVDNPEEMAPPEPDEATSRLTGVREEADGWGFLFSEESHVKCDLEGQFFVVMMDPSWREKDLDEPPHE